MSDTARKHAYKAGERYRVIRDGCKLFGMTPIHGGHQGWSMRLAKGEIITCQGKSMTFGDGVPVVKWADANGKFLAADCEFHPSTGGMWSQRPQDDCLELVTTPN